ncbi:MAG: Asp-tRNA(Asn)/Glu-tRNA(Gln) amidotransferase subunit GatC [Alphaproteobacteria bacterium]|nr:Asp-tRNA(Asn)/Glu-tRNA(Gln) amidotransferase subunit GatC [Alphaproteobacteria bacterium]
MDEQTVKRIAFLSRLKIDEDKIAATQDEFKKIIDWINLLQEVDTQGVEPMISVNRNNLVLRKDEVTDGNAADEVLANAPMKEYGYFAVPKVVEQ